MHAYRELSDRRPAHGDMAVANPEVFQCYVILASGGLLVGALRQATRTVPIVFVQVSDPVGGGFVESLARPGGNITGLTSISVEMEGKRLELLREVVPKVSHIAVLWNAASPIQVIEEGEVRAAAQVLGIKNAVSRSAYPGRIDDALATITRERPDALPRARRSAVPLPSHAHHGLCRPRALAGGACVPGIV